MKRLFLIGLGLCAILLSTMSVLALYTPYGLQWTVALATDMAPGTVTIGQVQGRLAGPIFIHGLEYQDDAMNVKIDRMELDWRAMALLTGNMHIDKLSAAGIDVKALTPASATSARTVHSYLAPLRISANHVEFTDITVHSPATAQPVKVASLKLRLDWFGDILQLYDLQLTHAMGQLSSHGTITLSDRFPLHLDTSWHWQSTLDTPALDGHGSLSGDLDRLLLEQNLTSPAPAHALLEIIDIDSTTHWRLAANIDSLPPALSAPILGATTVADISVNATGDFDQFDARGHFDTTIPDWDTITAAWSLNYSDQLITLREMALSFRGHPGTATATGSIHLQQQPVFDVNIAWRDLHGPVKSQITSAQGTLVVSGTSALYRTDFDLELGGQELPAMHWIGSGTGNLEKLSLPRITGIMLAGRVTGDAIITHQDGWRWRSHWQADKLKIADHWPEWDAMVSAQGTLSGSLEGNAYNFTGAIPKITGKLRAKPITGRAAFTLANDTLRIETLHLESGTTILTMLGNIDPNNIAMQWKARSDDLSTLHTQAAGSISLEGSIHGSHATPIITLSTNGNALRFKSYGAEHIDMALNMDLSGKADIGAYAVVTGLHAGSLSFRSLNANIKGPVSDHHAVIALQTAQQSLNLEFDAAYGDAIWRGMVKVLTIVDPIAGKWQLRKPAEFSLAKDDFKAHAICLENAPAYLCLDAAQWQRDFATLALQARQLPSQLWQPFLPQFLNLAGTFSGQLAVTQDQGQMVHLQAEGSIIDGGVTWSDSTPGSSPLHMDFSRIQIISVGTVPGKIDIKSQAQLQGNGSLSVHARFFALPAWPFDATLQTVSIKSDLALQQLSWMETMIPEVKDLSGGLNAHISLDGKLAAPVISGNVELYDGAVNLPRIGVTLSQLKINAVSTGARRLSISGEAHSGTGAVTLAGSLLLDSVKHWQSSFTLTGTDFEIARIPEARLVVSPKLSCQLEPGHVHIDGQIDVPEARIEPQDMRQALLPSGDVVIVGQERSAPETDAWTLTSNLRISANDSIRFIGYDFDGRIGGDLLLVDEPGKPTRASGELHSVTGSTYKAFNRKLVVEQGKLLFADTPVDNPALDITAVRSIGEIDTGVKVSGRMRAPVLTLFSRPPMDEAEILSYLTLGRPIASASQSEGATLSQAAHTAGLAGGDYLAQIIGQQFGLEEARLESRSDTQQPWLVLGTYLSPRLYVRYGVGLFESGQSVLLRYQLIKNWQLQGETGQTGGVDLLYSKERP